MMAAAYLAQKLDAKPIGDLNPAGNFDIQHVHVKNGLIASPRLPRGLFYRWVNPDGRDLILFLSEAQPNSAGYGVAQQILDRATSLNVERVVTFASLASQMHPSDESQVLVAASDANTLTELTALGAEQLQEGQIGGMNGLLLGAAASRGMSGACLMGSIPFFAAGLPNPRAARAVLEKFGTLSGIEIDLADLDAHVERMEDTMLELLERLKQSPEEGDERSSPEPSGEGVAGVPEEGGVTRGKEGLAFADRERVEGLFEEARRDKSKAMHLKAELDRLGVFALYENRFLDLFKRAE